MLRNAALATALFAGLAGPLWAQAAGSACSAGQVSGPDSLGNNLICSGGVFVAAGGYGGGGSSATDRISTSSVASGATLGMVVADQGTISFTLAGTEGRAYLHSTLGFVGPGVSTTGPISGTNGYFSGNVGVGTTAPSTSLHVNGMGIFETLGTGGFAKLAVRNGSTDNDALALYTMGISYTTLGAFVQDSAAIATEPSLSGGLSIMTRAAAPIRFYTSGYASTNERMRIDSGGNVGIGTTAPTSALQVSGTFTVSSTVTNANPALYVSTTGRIGIGVSDPEQLLHVNQLFGTPVILVKGSLAATGGAVLRAEADSGASISLAQWGTTYAGSVFNVPLAGFATLLAVNDADQKGIVIGTHQATPVIIGLSLPPIGTRL